MGWLMRGHLARGGPSLLEAHIMDSRDVVSDHPDFKNLSIRFYWLLS
jgi:hypothetical protein